MIQYRPHFIFFTNTIFVLLHHIKSCFESNAKQSAEMSTVAKSLPQILPTTSTPFI